MNKKLSKVLSVILAISMIFSTIAGLPFVASAEGTELDVWDGTAATAFAGGTGTEADPYLIATPEQFYYLATLGDGASGLYYKLNADIYLNDITKENWKESARQWDVSGIKFQANLDGDGHTVYGAYYNGSGDYISLFGLAGGTVSVKNLTVSDSEFTTSGIRVATLFGFSYGGYSISISKCYVTDSVNLTTTSSDTNASAGGFVAYGTGTVTVDNCAFFGTVSSSVMAGAIFGNLWYTASQPKTITNTIATPEVLFNGKNYLTTSSNNYGVGTSVTAENGVTRLESAELMKGAEAKTNMPNLDWRGVWAVTESGYPIYRNPNGVKGEAWGGLIANDFAGGTGTAADPYLIETPEQLAKMLFFGITTTDKYYKLTADIYLNDVSNADWASNSPISWYDYIDVNKAIFIGNIDGAGHTIHGLYYNGANLIGLLPRVSNTTVSNLRISNADVTSSAQVSALIGYFQNTVAINKCVIDETVKLTTTGTSGIAGIVAYGGSQTAINIDSCAVLADITSAGGNTGSMIGNVWNTTRTITNSFATTPMAFNGYQNTKVTFTNVYGVGDAVADETGVTRLESADLMKGAQAKTNMPNLNWRGVWQTTENDYPTYRDSNGVKGEAWSGAVADNFAGGSGTEADPFLIETPEQLAKMVKGGDTTGGYYKLTADIYLNDVAQADWKDNAPLSWYDRAAINNTAFVGNLDGAGYTIHGLYYTGASLFGLFPQASNTTITNLRISNSYVNSTERVAALVGFAQNTVTFKKCIVDETVSLTNTIASGGQEGIGGFVAYGSPNVFIEDSAVMATINSNTTNSKGAFIGNCWSTSVQRSISFSYTTSELPLAGHVSHGISVNNTYRIGEDPSASIITGSAIALDSADLMKGAAAKTNMPLLDWGIWSVTESGFPVISGEKPEGYYTIEELEGLYKTQGRTELLNNTLYIDWSASGIEFNAECSGNVVVTFNTDKIVKGATDGIYFTVVVDGIVQYENLRMPEDTASDSWLSNSTGYPYHIQTAGKSMFVIAKDLPAGKHTFAIYNQTEAEKASYGITAIDLNGEFVAPPEDNELYIEFIGDSITANAGILTDSSGENTTLYQDATRGWPYLTAKALGADWSVLAKSGITAGNGYGWYGENGASMQTVYPKTRYYANNTSDYAFTRQPDVVVLGLGTNDMWTYADYDKTKADVEAEFEAMIALVREKNPNAKIVWVYGMMRDDATSIIKKAVADMGGKSSGIYSLELPTSTDGAKGHPSLEVQTTYAQKLSAYITDLINEVPDEDEIWNGTLEKFTNGSGTAADPYLIENAEQLAYMVAMGDETSGKYFKLTTNIYLNDVSASNWTDSAKEWNGKSSVNDVAFQGTLDGAGHKIYGLYINGSDSQYTGLVSKTSGTATFKNVIISDSHIVNNYSSNASASAFVGLGSGTVNFEKCGITESVEVISAVVAGGFVANGNCVVNISDSYSLGHFESLVDPVAQPSLYRRGSMVGGIYWSSGGTRNVTITNSFAKEAFSTYYVGTITNSYTAEQLDTETFTVTQAPYVEDSLMKGAAAETNMPNLDWKAVWTTTDSGYPIHRNTNGVKGEVWTGVIAEDYAAGSGTALNPYVIETPEQLAKMLIEGTSETGKYYVLGADIYLNDVSKADWASNSPNSWYDRAAINYTAFVGTLDGAGYTIHGLYYNGSDRAALFPQASNTTITNLRISNADVTSSNAVAALVGYGQETLTFKKCIVDETVKITTTESGTGAAGFVAYNSPKVYIYDSAVMATITAPDTMGAFIGNIWGNTAAARVIKNSFSAANVPMTGHKSNSITVENCYNIGTENFAYTGTVNKLDSAELMKGANALDNMPLLTGFYATTSYPTVFYSGIEGTVWSGAVADKFAGGNGSSNNPYIIKTAEQLVRMLKTDSTGKYYELVADIKLNKDGATDNSWFTSKSEGIKAFKGTLNGNGYVVSGLYYNGSIEWNNTNVGFIPIASNAVISDLSLTDSSITLYSTLAESGASYVGGIIGFVDDDSRVIGCYVDDTVKLSNSFADNSNSQNAQVGGIIGGGDDSILIDGCIFTGELTWTEGARYGAAFADVWKGTGTKTIRNTFTANYVPTSVLVFNGLNNIGTVAPVTDTDLDSSYTVVENATGKEGLEAIAAINANDEFYWTEGFPALKATGMRMGDINGDRKGNALDMTALRKHILGVAEFGLTDLNEDGFSDVRDLVNLKKKGLDASALVDFEITSDYVITYDANNADLYSEALALKEYYLLNEGVALTVADADSAVAEKTIALTVDTNMGDGAYSVSQDGDNIVISGGHTQTVMMANREFLRSSQNGKISLFNLSSDFTSTAPIGDEYVYVWGDEFEQDSLDISKWDRYHRVWNQLSGTNDLVIDYSNSNSSTKVEDGLLKLHADNYIDNNDRYVVPATVSTKDSMSFKYGYLEMKAKIPFGTGCWPGFWMSSGRALNANQDADYTIEIDIFEQFASKDTVVPNIHKWYTDGSGKHTQWAGEDVYTFTEWENLNNEYHLYGFKWTPTEITMYVDGVAYYTYDLTNNFDGISDMSGFDTAVSVLINNHLFTQNSSYKPYVGCEIENAEENLPAEYYIDWIRLYQNGEGELNLAN